MRVLVAPDSYKGSLTAAEVADALADGLEDREGEIDVSTLPLADGGDGTVEAAIAAGFDEHTVVVRDALGRKTECEFAFDGETVIISTANTIGLADLGDALDGDIAISYGLGQMLRAALELNPKRIVVGLGGSATTDGGAGMLAALGAKVKDARRHELRGCVAELGRARQVELSRLRDFDDVELIGASDVTNPLCGPKGAARVFGPQKGVHDIEGADRALSNWVERLEEAGVENAVDFSTTPGAGAAGGLGFAILLLGGRLVSGADYFLDMVGFDEAVAEADVVITGEGALDAQTADGKLISRVIARSGDVPVHAVVGTLNLGDEQVRELGLQSVTAVNEVAGVDTHDDDELTGDTLEQIGREISLGTPAVVR
ncbi:MAG: glycerate kinase [Agrococcus casei]|uniref:glycerate kinase n=1 Tax=Agrococcus casei TaxID=343512 RepID=UPI003F8DCF55